MHHRVQEAVAPFFSSGLQSRSTTCPKASNTHSFHCPLDSCINVSLSPSLQLMALIPLGQQHPLFMPVEQHRALDGAAEAVGFQPEAVEVQISSYCCPEWPNAIPMSMSLRYTFPSSFAKLRTALPGRKPPTLHWMNDPWASRRK